MPIKTTCSGCQRAINAPDRYSGKKIKCPKCETPIVIPSLPERPDPRSKKTSIETPSKKATSKKIKNQAKPQGPKKPSSEKPKKKATTRKRTSSENKKTSSQTKAKGKSRKKEASQNKTSPALGILLGLFFLLILIGASVWWFLTQSSESGSNLHITNQENNRPTPPATEVESPQGESQMPDTRKPREAVSIEDKTAEGLVWGKDVAIKEALFDRSLGILKLKSEETLFPEREIAIHTEITNQSMAGKSFLIPGTATPPKVWIGWKEEGMTYPKNILHEENYEMQLRFHSEEEGFLKGEIDLITTGEKVTKISGRFQARLK